MAARPGDKYPIEIVGPGTHVADQIGLSVGFALELRPANARSVVDLQAGPQGGAPAAAARGVNALSAPISIYEVPRFPPAGRRGGAGAELSRVRRTCRNTAPGHGDSPMWIFLPISAHPFEALRGHQRTTILLDQPVGTPGICDLVGLPTGPKCQ